jgi:hypothetical protein
LKPEIKTGDKTMKSTTNRFMFITAATLALSVSAAYGQNTMSADVPFSFSVAGKTMPAGHYQVIDRAAQSGSPILAVSNVKSHESAVVVATNRLYAADVKGNTASRLTFACRASGCYLKEVWKQGNGGVAFRAPKLSPGERERMATIYFSSKTNGD